MANRHGRVGRRQGSPINGAILVLAPVLAIGAWYLWFTSDAKTADEHAAAYGYGAGVSTSGMPTSQRQPPRIESQFSGWDGSHAALTRQIKERLHDPDSYDHVKTAHQVRDGRVYIVASFRANNALGATALTTVTAEASPEGDGSDVRILSWQ